MWPENIGAVNLFCALDTQWNIVAGMNGVMVTGLNYASAEVLMRIHGMKKRAELLADLQVMERAALAVMNDQLKAARRG